MTGVGTILFPELLGDSRAQSSRERMKPTWNGRKGSTAEVSELFQGILLTAS
jgi:hypothetical protein